MEFILKHSSKFSKMVSAGLLKKMANREYFIIVMEYVEGKKSLFCIMSIFLDNSTPRTFQNYPREYIE